jgi:glycosyltransferase involved in cell wall biosynthesis
VPFARLRHLESVTRGSSVPSGDFFASYWRYNAFLFGGDPYFSPNLSLGSRRLALRGPDEPTPQERVAPAIGRNLTVFRQRNDEAESRMLADQCRVDETDVLRVRELHAANAGPFDVRTVNWYIPDIDSPFYGGINTALRMADYLAREHGVENRFVVWGTPPDSFVRSAIAAAFPSPRRGSDPLLRRQHHRGEPRGVPDSDVSIATLWVTAYAVAKAPRTRRKVYLVPGLRADVLPGEHALRADEETYRLGLYGLCNTANLERIYREDYDGTGFAFTPAVSDQVFHARGRRPRRAEDPVTVFVYARPGHWRNCWELASLAPGGAQGPDGGRRPDRHRGVLGRGRRQAGRAQAPGLLDYRATGDLYRRCDVGLALTVSKHPSYLPLELMACGVPVVAFDNPWGHWILKDGHNSLLAQRTVPSLTDKLHGSAPTRSCGRRPAPTPSPTSLPRTPTGRPPSPGSTPTSATRRRSEHPGLAGHGRAGRGAARGAAIRAVELARAATGRGHAAEVVTTTATTSAVHGVPVRHLPVAAAPRAGGHVGGGGGRGRPAGPRPPAVGGGAARLVVDLYDPFHLEQLEQSKHLPPGATRPWSGPAWRC